MLSAKDKATDARYRREYGITLNQYLQVLKYQGGVCAICKRYPRPGKRLHVDHNHKTGELRGLLCWSCNRAIACFDDCAVKMREAAQYILNPPVRNAIGEMFTAPGKVGSKSRAKLLIKMKASTHVN